jgi:hypothetical protein
LFVYGCTKIRVRVQLRDEEIVAIMEREGPPLSADGVARMRDWLRPIAAPFDADPRPLRLRFPDTGETIVTDGKVALYLGPRIR